jgi:hypothetical protein
MNITMDEPTPTPDPQAESASRLFHALTQTMAAYVRKLVEARFDELVANRNTLKLMDVELFERIETMIDKAVIDHEGSEPHVGEPTIEQIAADTARETLSEYASRQEGWVTKDQVNDLIIEHVDSELDLIEWDEKVKDVLRDML